MAPVREQTLTRLDGDTYHALCNSTGWRHLSCFVRELISGVYPTLASGSRYESGLACRGSQLTD
jgi:hypothetical protein